VLETVATGGDLSNTRVRTLLGAFLFHDEDVDKPIAVLSGGERARVALARLLVDPGNTLLMDEPTNHLDLASSEALAAALATFDGTLVFVSHNRSFVRQLATKIWNVEDGHVDTYPGTLDEYLDSHGRTHGGKAVATKPTGLKTTATTTTTTTAAATTAASADRSGGGKPVRSREDDRARKRAEADRRRALGPLQARVRELEATIERLEADQRARNLELSRPETYENAERRRVLLGEYQRDADALAQASEAWALASAELEEATS
jgi:ATP-binding cassette subfamily F protein 3